MILVNKSLYNKCLILIMLLYILSSYLCQETLLPTKINSLLLYGFVAFSFVVILLMRGYVNYRFSRWYLIFFVYSSLSAMLMADNVFPTLYQMFVVLILTICFSVSIDCRTTLNLTAITFVVAAVLMGLLIILYNPSYLIVNLGELSGVRLGEEETGNANIFTALMMFSAVFASWLIFYHTNIVIRILCGLSLLLILYLMALSGGRKTIIAVVACLLYFIWKKCAKKKITAMISILIILCAIIYMMKNIPWLYDIIGYRFDGFFGFLSGTRESNVSSDDLRIDMIKNGLIGWTERPLFGHGLDSFKFFNRRTTGHMFYSHNNYVELLYDFGLVGFTLYYYFIYKTFDKLRTLPEEYSKYSVLGIGIILELLLFDFGGVSYYMNGNMIMLCIVSQIAYSSRLINSH